MALNAILRKTGLISPVAFSAGLFLLVLSPLFRGGNRQVAMIATEGLSLGLLFALSVSIFMGARVSSRRTAEADGRSISVGLNWMEWCLLASPVVLGLIYLIPIPIEWWVETGGRGIYTSALAAIGIADQSMRPLSLNPEATWTSLLAGLPLVAAYLLGRLCSLAQLRWLCKVLVGIGFFQVAVGVLQLVAGGGSFLYFDGGYPDSAIGTFANRSHFANYLAMILPLYVWLAFSSGNPEMARAGQRRGREAATSRAAFVRNLIWAMGGFIIVLGILLSRSRGAAFTGLPMGLLAVTVAATVRSGKVGWKVGALLIIMVLAAAAALLGVDFLTSRIQSGQLGQSAAFRSVLVSSTLAGATEFWPWGAGWGVYESVYPRFQPELVGGYVEYAHHDYVHLLFEGGIFGVVLLAIWAVLFVVAAFRLAVSIRSSGFENPETMLALVSGFALVGVMLHAVAEFSMHIPANAILAALLAGIYLRPSGPSR